MTREDWREIAIAIAVEGGGYGGSAAAPIARKVFDAWLIGEAVMGDSGLVIGNSDGNGGSPAADASASPESPITNHESPLREEHR